MAKRIQDFRKFNSSNEGVAESISANSKTTKKSSKVISSSLGKKNIKKAETRKNINEKKDKPKNNTNKFITAFFIIIILVGVGVGCLFSPTFDFTSVIVKAGDNVSKEEILNTFHIEKGINVFKIDYKDIEKSVKKLPYIQSVKASLKIPNEVLIEYVEREPFALVKYLESYLVMDKYGYILEISRERKFDLPIIYNIEFDSYEIGSKLEDTAKTKYDNVVYLLENATNNKFKYTILEINYESINNVKIWIEEEDIEIIYGEIDRNIIMDKLNYITGILEKVSGKSGRIDVSSENYLDKAVFTERF